MLPQPAQDVVFHPLIASHNPDVSRRPTSAGKPGPSPGRPHGLGGGNSLCGEDPVEAAAHTQFLGERPSVTSRDAGDAIVSQVTRRRLVRPPVAHHRRELPDDEPAYVWPP